jgi:RHH-type transcriptional regulator, proline utilization regulon repressor / proline dehydrogenase / delta 1-pyrroline-5-carboxylate dehydrogenase
MGNFGNTPDTDPSVGENRAWARSILRGAAASSAGTAVIDAARVANLDELQSRVDSTRSAGVRWGTRGGTERAEVLHAIGDAIEAHRGELLEVMIAEAGKTFDQADPEVSEAVDFAHFYAEQARVLDDVDGATFEPAALTLVTPPWNFPIAIPAGSVLAALAAGSAAILKPAGPAERCGAVLAHVIRDALRTCGVAAEVLTLVQVDERTLGRELVAHPLVDQVILTGAFETAELFRSFRPDLRLIAETSGKNAIIVTPSADFDLAVRDVVHAAFSHAGQKCSAASLLVLVGSVVRSRRFHRQLEDAIASLTVGYPTDPTAQMGPVVEPANGKLLDGLTTLGPGERWILQPRPLDDTGRLWSPGLRDGVQPGSAFHTTEYFGPILGIMQAATLDDAIDIVNQVDYGLTSGLHSLDRDEIATWLDRVQAGNLYVNRGTTGAIVRRQPFGGWKRSAVGPGAKAGGVNQLLTLGTWKPRPAIDGTPPTDPTVLSLLERTRPHLSDDDCALLLRAAASDAKHWREHFATALDVSALPPERNIARYRPFPTPLTVRLDTNQPVDLVRLVSAAATAGAHVHVSVSPAVTISDELQDILSSTDTVLSYDIETAQDFSRRVDRLIGGRVRVIGSAVPTSAKPDVSVYAGPVTEGGRIELLPFVREQAVSITAHRFGTPDHLTDELI